MWHKADKISADSITTKGVLMGNSTNTSVGIEVTPKFLYKFYVVAEDADGNVSAPSTDTVMFDRK